MITDKNKAFVIRFGPSSIHDDHIAHGIHQESTAKSLTITPDHIDRIWPTATTLDKRHMIANHYDRMSDNIKAKIDESEDLSRFLVSMSRIQKRFIKTSILETLIKSMSQVIIRI